MIQRCSNLWIVDEMHTMANNILSVFRQEGNNVRNWSFEWQTAKSNAVSVIAASDELLWCGGHDPM